MSQAQIFFFLVIAFAAKSRVYMHCTPRDSERTLPMFSVQSLAQAASDDPGSKFSPHWISCEFPFRTGNVSPGSHRQGDGSDFKNGLRTLAPMHFLISESQQSILNSISLIFICDNQPLCTGRTWGLIWGLALDAVYCIEWFSCYFLPS